MADGDGTPRHVFLIDASGFIFRAFHALPPLTRPDGTPVNAVLGFTNMILKLLTDTNADAVVCVFDRARKSFRNEIYPDYKAHRPDAPPELVPQFALVREAARAFGLRAIDMDGFEADDIIATYARQGAAAGAEVTIVSSDKDLMQLIDGGIAMYDALKGRPISAADVAAKFGVSPDKVAQVQALAGDSSDNVPGVPGIGVKTAAELIGAYGDVETLLARTDEIKQPKRRENLKAFADQARVSLRLVTLKDDVPVPLPLAELRSDPPDAQKLMDFLETQGFKSVVPRAAAWLGRQGAGPTAAAGAVTAAPAPKPARVAIDGYVLVQDEAELGAWLAEARRTGVVGFDTETTGLDATRAELVGFSLALAPGRACYVPVAHRPRDAFDGTIRQIGRDAALALLKPLLEDDMVLKIGHNIKYDAVVLAGYGVDITPVDDTMLLSFVLEGGLHEHNMDALARLHLDHTTIAFKDVAGSGKNQVTFDLVPLDRARDYAAEDADVTLRLHGLLKPRLIAEHMVTMYETIERPLIPVLRDMERAGIPVERATLERLSADLGRRLVELEAVIHKLAGHPFAIGSPKQLGEVLFDEMGLGGGKKGKTGAYGTGADILEDLAAQGHDLPARVLDWRQLAKLKSTYTDTLVEQINPVTGRVHTSFAMAGSSTGRLASTDPNLQNVPVRTEEGRKIREAFVAAPGHVLLSADYSQIELRLLAHIADIAALKQAFHDGADIHALTASQVFGVPVDDMDPAVRRSAKAINFGIIYGISAFGLARQLGIPQDAAAKYIKAYFERYPGIRAYMEQTRTFARANGYVWTMFGRRIHTPGIVDKNPARRGFWERAAINAPLQGSAADIIKRAMIRIPGALATARLRARMLLQVHDELLFEVPEAEAERTAQVVKATMEGAARLSVPLVVDTGTGRTWASAH
ncbi:MAG: DNA polymerase I [Alphaproteobacteria bacterium]|nr:DNA polymerase I [Alphaproteobacteria bacterium]